MVSSPYRRSKSLAADAARWWNQLKVERGKYLDATSTMAKLVKSLLGATFVVATPEETSLSPIARRISLVEALQELILTMKDAFFEVERCLIDIMGNDLMKPVTPEQTIELVRTEAKQLDLLFIAAKNYIKVKNRFQTSLVEEKGSELLNSARYDLTQAFETIQRQVVQTEEALNNVYEEMKKQRELADLLEKKQLL